MELSLATTIGFMFGAGTYLILRPNLIRIVLGFGLYSNAVNLLLICCGGFPSASAEGPFFGGGDIDALARMDPIPPDIILTAIVISFAVGALFLTICYCVYLDYGTDDPEKLPSSPYAAPKSSQRRRARHDRRGAAVDRPAAVFD